MINKINNMHNAIFIVNADKTKVMATTKNSAFQLFNEGVIKGPYNANEWPLQPNIWYDIQGDRDGYGMWVLENEFPNTKGDELILVKYL